MKTNTYISARSYHLIDYLKRLPRYKEFFFTLVQRELKVKFVQTKLGWLWALAQPLLILLVFTILFNQLIPLDTGEIAYPLYAFSGMAIWYLFSNISNAIGRSLHEGQDLMRKISFPRMLLPFSKGLSTAIESSGNFLLLFLLCFFYSTSIKINIAFILLGIIYTLMIGLFIGIVICTLTVKKRDLQHLIPPLINTAIWLTPVFYPSNIIPSKFINAYYFFNPIAGALSTFRAGLFNEAWSWWYISSSPVIMIGLIIILLIFIKKEKNILDNL